MKISEKSKEAEQCCYQLLNICKYKDITSKSAEKKLNTLDEIRVPIVFSLLYTMMEEYWIRDMYDIPDLTFVVRNNEEALPVFENAVRFYHNLPKDCESLKETFINILKENGENFG